MSSRPVKNIVDRLREHGCNPRQSGENWCATCPAHEDSTPSLTISEGADGRALVFDHAGCSTESVLAAIGMQLRETFVSPDASRGIRPRVDPRAVVHTPQKPAQDWAALSERFAAAVDPQLLDSLSRELGVDSAALSALRIGWATREDLAAIIGKRPGSAASGFPMMRGHGETVALNARPR